MTWIIFTLSLAATSAIGFSLKLPLVNLRAAQSGGRVCEPAQVQPDGQRHQQCYENSPLTVKGLLNGIEQNDFDQIYFVGNTVYTQGKEASSDPEAGTDTVYVYNTDITPYITTKLVDASIKNGLDPVFISVPSVPAAPAPPAPGPMDAFFMIVYGLIAWNVLRNVFMLFRQMPRSRNGDRDNTPGFGPFGPFSMASSPKPSKPAENVTFHDWAGSPEVLAECSEIVTFLKNNTAYERVGAKIPRGILMDGPPGTGKTLLAKAIANEADAAFIEMSGSEFIEMYVGLGALRVRTLFDDARKQSPCVIFIDEIDAVGKRRNGGDGPMTSGNDEKDQTLNQLLAEMDGFKNNTGILVLAATNRRDILDPALLRPGRFDRIVSIPLPDMRSRQQILDLYLREAASGPTSNGTTLDVKKWAKFTVGSSGADLRNLVNEAKIQLARQGETTMTEAALYAAWEKQLLGIKKTVDDRSDAIRCRVAIHELGHAWMAHVHSDLFDLQKVSIQASYSGTGGFTLFSEKEELVEGGLYTRDMLVKRIMVALGGKAAEELFYGAENVSVGATMDLRQANSLASDMIEKYGMGAELNVFYKGPSQSFAAKYSDYTQEMIDREANDIVKEAYHRTLTTLRNDRDVLMRLVPPLMDNMTIDRDAWTALVQDAHRLLRDPGSASRCCDDGIPCDHECGSDDCQL